MSNLEKKLRKIGLMKILRNSENNLFSITLSESSYN